MFGTEEFAALSLADKAAFIRAKESHLENLTQLALDYIGTILLRASCGCELVGAFIDLDGSVQTFDNHHPRYCPRFKYPTLQDLADSTIRRRQRLEMLASPDTLRILEETTTQ